MVLLAMTPEVAEVVGLYIERGGPEDGQEPSLKQPVEGNPISHNQLIDIAKYLKNRAQSKPSNGGKALPTRLDELLKGCALYTPPKPTQTPKVCFPLQSACFAAHIFRPRSMKS
jgi:hypothetical protein